LVPISRLVREDLHSVNRVTTASGGVTYRAPHSADGHADRCTALALALRARKGQEQGNSIDLCLRLNREIQALAAARRNRCPFQ
jgi:phage FluMu gp28-like protein